MTTQIETVKVDFEEFRANLFHYARVIETKRVVVMREGEEVAVGLRHDLRQAEASRRAGLPTVSPGMKQ